MTARTKNPVVDATGETRELSELAHSATPGAAYALLDPSCTYKEGPDMRKSRKAETPAEKT
jgi:hypothetical protein